MAGQIGATASHGQRKRTRSRGPGAKAGAGPPMEPCDHPTRNSTSNIPGWFPERRSRIQPAEQRPGRQPIDADHAACRAVRPIVCGRPHPGQRHHPTHKPVRRTHGQGPAAGYFNARKLPAEPTLANTAQAGNSHSPPDLRDRGPTGRPGYVPVSIRDDCGQPDLSGFVCQTPVLTGGYRPSGTPRRTRPERWRSPPILGVRHALHPCASVSIRGSAFAFLLCFALFAVPCFSLGGPAGQPHPGYSS
jgi:hypothetical protein